MGGDAELLNLAITIMGDIRRSAMVDAMRKQLPMAEVVMDTDQSGPWLTAKRAWLRGEGATHNLVVQEDIGLCKDFLAGAEAAIEVNPFEIISFFSMSSVIKKALGKNKSWVKLRSLSWAQAIVMPMNVVFKFMEWEEDNVAPSFKGDDARISLYALNHYLDVWHTAPSLVEHLGWEEGIAGNPAKLGGRPRVASAFCEGSAKEIDWSRGLAEPYNGGGHSLSAYKKWMKNGTDKKEK